MTDKTTKKPSEEEINTLATKYLDMHNGINGLIDDVNQSVDISDDSFLKLGDQLAIIFDEIEANDKPAAKKIFIALKKQTAEKVKAFDVNTINKVVKVARNKVISQYRNENKLPNRWGTLYLLTSFSDEKIHDLIAFNDITVDTTRKELKQIADGIKGKKSSPTQTKRLTIKRADGKEVTKKEMDKLEQFLLKNDWVLCGSKSEISTETETETE
jgi:hypothetical protein